MLLIYSHITVCTTVVYCMYALQWLNTYMCLFHDLSFCWAKSDASSLLGNPNNLLLAVELVFCHDIKENRIQFWQSKACVLLKILLVHAESESQFLSKKYKVCGGLCKTWGWKHRVGNTRAPYKHPGSLVHFLMYAFTLTDCIKLLYTKVYWEGNTNLPQPSRLYRLLNGFTFS